MKNKTKRVNKYLILDIFGTAAYLLILYFGFTLLAGFSLLLAYLWNFALIIIFVILDGHTNKMLLSDETIMAMKEKYGAEKASSLFTGGLISFKSYVYLLYLFILIASQIIELYPTLLNANLTEFIHANNYSILFLLAFDAFIGQFSKDKERISEITAKLNEPSDKNRDRK